MNSIDLLILEFRAIGGNYYKSGVSKHGERSELGIKIMARHVAKYRSAHGDAAEKEIADYVAKNKSLHLTDC